MEDPQQRWKYLYAEYLPSLAKAKDPAQGQWPVVLDHCFARIILDNAIGKDRPWTEVLKSPAINNMGEEQLRSAIELAEKIAGGEANLVELDERSLGLRGKKSKQPGKRKAGDEKNSAKPTKKRRDDETISSYFLPSPSSPKPEQESKEMVESKPDHGQLEQQLKELSDDPEASTRTIQLQRIQNSSLTPFRKQTLSLLCHIPRGRYSTYQAMSDHITATSHKTCARAVGNAMRNNPFAPEVPCHRILAADGTLGGFNGHWGEEGKFAGSKKELLAEEGVRFDSMGKVKGRPFRGWK